MENLLSPGKSQDERYLEDDERRVQDRGRGGGVCQVWGGRHHDLDTRGAPRGVQQLSKDILSSLSNL